VKATRYQNWFYCWRITCDEDDDKNLEKKFLVFKMYYIRRHIFRLDFLSIFKANLNRDVVDVLYLYITHS
jgi:hypothetical protein